MTDCTGNCCSNTKCAAEPVVPGGFISQGLPSAKEQVGLVLLDGNLESLVSCSRSRNTSQIAKDSGRHINRAVFLSMESNKAVTDVGNAFSISILESASQTSRIADHQGDDIRRSTVDTCPFRHLFYRDTHVLGSLESGNGFGHVVDHAETRRVDIDAGVAFPRLFMFQCVHRMVLSFC